MTILEQAVRYMADNVGWRGAAYKFAEEVIRLNKELSRVTAERDAAEREIWTEVVRFDP